MNVLTVDVYSLKFSANSSIILIRFVIEFAGWTFWSYSPIWIGEYVLNIVVLVRVPLMINVRLRFSNSFCSNFLINGLQVDSVAHFTSSLQWVSLGLVNYNGWVSSIYGVELVGSRTHLKTVVVLEIAHKIWFAWQWDPSPFAIHFL